jgi:hypothetical protein
MKRPALFLGAALLLLLGAMAFKGHLLALPDVRSASQQGQFDTNRAMERLSRILGDQRPHPVDSEANDLVRARLVAELRAIGLQPRISDHFACNGRNRGMTCARVRNVTATIGPAEGRHVLVVSHYDSVPVGPGAADDGIGVATMLETAALLSRTQLRRPVTFLFNEGEEAGLLGARAFLDHDPIAARVDSLVNLEARGVTGPALMFETSRPNAAAIDHYARSAARPAANSLSADFYRMIPNSTDVAVFEERPWTILNFAIIGNETRYHSPGDRLEALDPKSVQHMGDQALALVSDLANGTSTAEGTEIFADLLGRTLITLPLEIGVALLVLAIGGLADLGWRRRAGFGRGILAALAALIASTAIAFLGQWVLGLVRSGEYWRAYPGATSIAVASSALLGALAALLWIATRVSTGTLRAAYWLLFAILGAALAIVAPGALIFFILPPSIMLAGAIAARRFPAAERAAALLAALLLFLTLGPILALIEMLLGHGAAWSFAPLAALILLPWLIELMPAAGPLPRTRVLGGLATAALVCWIGAVLAPAYSLDRKQKFGIEYVWDGAAKRAQWMIVNDGAPLPEAIARAAPFRSGTEVPWSGRRRWAAPAEGSLAAASTLQPLGETRSGAVRRIKLRIAAHGAQDIAIQAPPEAAIMGLRAGSWERSFPQGRSDEGYGLRCRGRSCEGLLIELVAGTRPVPLTIVGVRPGLPASARALLQARPADAAPQYNPDATITLDRLKL